MKKQLALQFIGEDGNWWTHKYVSSWFIWLAWFYNVFSKFTPKNSRFDPHYVSRTCRIKKI